MSRRRPNSHWCEYCGTVFHTAAGAAQCRKLPACSNLGFPPKQVVGNWKVRGCAALLARTAGDMLARSSVARQSDKVKMKGENIMKWADRAYKALEANTPISLGCATRLHRGLTGFVDKHVWSRHARLPHLFIIEVASLYVTDAIEFVFEVIETESHKMFWFQEQHPEFLLYDAVSTPLAIYISQMKVRRQTNGAIDAALQAYGHPSRPKNHKEVRPVEVDLLGEMLDHCWRDELRAWRYLQGALDTARKDIHRHGTEESTDLSKHDPDLAYMSLMDFIWAEELPAKAKSGPPMKLWLVDDRHWVAALNRKNALRVIAKDTGLICKKVEGVDLKKKLYNELGVFVETAQELIDRYGREMYIGRA